MSDYVDRLERQLVEAANHPVSVREARNPRRRAIPASAVAVIAALLIVSAMALAVTGTFSTGSSVRPPVHPIATAGAGVPAGGTRLLPARAFDPAGGLPWGMRLVRTTRGLVCLQIGRVEGSHLGVLGEDGAFGGDGRFHPVAADVVGYHRVTAEQSLCLPAGQTTSMEAGVPQSAVMGTRHSERIPPRDRRWISYGLLGPHAVSVSYESKAGERTIPVERGSGAYLIVLPDPPKGAFEVSGGASSFNGPVTPQGAVSFITYRVHGRACRESRPANESQAAHPGCPHRYVSPPRGTPRRLHHPIAVRVAADGTALVTFTAPLAVRSARSGYVVEVPVPCHKGTSGTPVERDVQAGEVVHVRLPAFFANSCGRRMTVRVLYERDRERILVGSGDVIVGETVVGR